MKAHFCSAVCTAAIVLMCATLALADIQIRPFDESQWPGHAISYGPHRDDQRPGGNSPSESEIREDLHLMQPHWQMLRLYGSTGVAETVLSVIRQDKLNLKVMLGVWIAVEDSPAAIAANQAEARAAIRLAAAYPEVVAAISVGNETQIIWSAHRSPLDILTAHVRLVRSQSTVPVTVADDFNFWNKPESKSLAKELDFLTIHAHPMWNGVQREESLTWVQKQLNEIQLNHPKHRLVLGETGWATSVHDQGEQAKLIKGRPGAAEQKLFYDEIRAWSEAEHITVFFFEAFDENWKGGSHAAEVEKHWGVFDAARSPKSAVKSTP